MDSSIVIIIIALLFSVIVHEVAHGWVADKLGDPTARYSGRLTLNPIPHIDPVFTIIVPVIMYMSMGFVFGGAKPVPVNPYNFKRPRKGMAIVAAAGPASNLLLMTIGIITFKISVAFGFMPHYFHMFLEAFVLVNGILMGFNLIPIPPLDGSRILMGFLDNETAYKFESLSRYGFIILIGIILFGNVIGVSIFGLVLRPLFYLINTVMY